MHGVPSRLREFCEWLGDDPDEIADTLAALDCDGVRGAYRKCPLAVAIDKHVETWPGAKVTGNYVRFGDPQIIDYLLPQPVAIFIKRFDNGQYLFLEKERNTRNLRSHLAYEAAKERAKKS